MTWIDTENGASYEPVDYRNIVKATNSLNTTTNTFLTLEREDQSIIQAVMNSEEDYYIEFQDINRAGQADITTVNSAEEAIKLIHTLSKNKTPVKNKQWEKIEFPKLIENKLFDILSYIGLGLGVVAMYFLFKDTSQGHDTDYWDKFLFFGCLSCWLLTPDFICECINLYRQRRLVDLFFDGIRYLIPVLAAPILTYFLIVRS